MQNDDFINLIVKYGQEYQKKLKSTIFDHNKVERMLNEWIKHALNLYENNKNITIEEFEKILSDENVVLK